jgi:AcrR family transcriptional regulator
MSPRPRLDHVRRPVILAAAAELIRERGVEHARVADVAERAGTSAAGVLYWFDSKDELLAEALTSAEDAFHARLTAELDQLDSAGERLRLLIAESVGGEDWTLWMELWTRALRDAIASALLIFALSFDDFVIAFFTTGESPTPLPVQIYSSIRFGVRPTINAIGTFMAVISFLIVALAIALPRILGRREEGNVLIGREAA